MEVIKTKKPNLKWSKMDQYKLFKREKEVGQVGGECCIHKTMRKLGLDLHGF